MKKRTVITTNKSEVWVIRQMDSNSSDNVGPENVSKPQQQKMPIDIESPHDSVPETSVDEKAS